jgi:hypothetical protein
MTPPRVRTRSSPQSGFDLGSASKEKTFALANDWMSATVPEGLAEGVMSISAAIHPDTLVGAFTCGSTDFRPALMGVGIDGVTISLVDKTHPHMNEQPRWS